MTFSSERQQQQTVAYARIKSSHHKKISLIRWLRTGTYTHTYHAVVVVATCHWGCTRCVHIHTVNRTKLEMETNEKQKTQNAVRSPKGECEIPSVHHHQTKEMPFHRGFFLSLCHSKQQNVVSFVEIVLSPFHFIATIVITQPYALCRKYQPAHGSLVIKKCPMAVGCARGHGQWRREKKKRVDVCN